MVIIMIIAIMQEPGSEEVRAHRGAAVERCGGRLNSACVGSKLI